jgi:hypothetical protein
MMTYHLVMNDWTRTFHHRLFPATVRNFSFGSKLKSDENE